MIMPNYQFVPINDLRPGDEIASNNEDMARGLSGKSRNKYEGLKKRGVIHPEDMDLLFFGLALEGRILPGDYMIHLIPDWRTSVVRSLVPA